MMNDELRQKIRRIRIHTRRVMHSSLSGDYLSAFKGVGLEFDQIRDYQMGDDVRFIDWNSSAKMNKIMVKQFREERDRTVILAIDVSASQHHSSKSELKKDVVAEIAAALAFVADHNKDKVGALFFSDRIEKWLPPSRGKVHLGSIIQTIFSLEAQERSTNIQEALRFLVHLKKRNAIVFLISDWIDQSDYVPLLKVARQKFDLIGIRLLDDVEHEIPDVGMLDVQDPETGSVGVLATGSFFPWERGTKTNLFIKERLIKQKRMFERYRIDMLDLVVGRSFVNPMISFFHQRIRRQV